MYKEKRPQIGDLVRLIERDWHTGYDLLLGVVIEQIGIRCRVFYTDGRMGDPMREALEVI
mgnify:FL=1|jgi:hypothetical protein